MRFTTPEIAWHNRDPVYSLDIQPCLTVTSNATKTVKKVPFLPGVNADTFLTLPALTYGTYPPKSIKPDQEETLTYRVASAGADSSVVVWRVEVNHCHPAQKIKLDPVAQLTRHENAVNVIRFVPTGDDVFASASVDRTIIIWKRVDENSKSLFSSPKSSKSNISPKRVKLSPSVKAVSGDSAATDQAKSDVKPSTPAAKSLTVTSKSGNRIALTTLSTPNTTSSVAAPAQPEPSSSFISNSDEICDEQWIQHKVFRGHLEDVVDISWSSDGLHLLSGSVDNEAILWDVSKGTRLAFLTGHKGWVQGVAIDPLSNYLATMSCDRILRIFNFNDRKILHKVDKAVVSTSDLTFVGKKEIDQLISSTTTPRSKVEQSENTPANITPGKPVEKTEVPDHFTSKLFYDYTMQSFARRLFFSPNGEFLLVPSGVIEFPKNQDKTDSRVDSGFFNACHIFTRSNLSKPVAYFPLFGDYCHAVRFCPTKFSLMQEEDAKNGDQKTDQPPSAFPMPYRLVFAIATHNSVLVYDTQHTTPIAYLTDIHYTRITDLTWSLDGRLLLISSTDGFVTFVTFDKHELGEVYVEPTPPPTPEKVEVACEIASAQQANQAASSPSVSSQPRIPQLFAAMNKAA